MYALKRRLDDEEDLDERVILGNVTWQAFEALLAARGCSSVFRLYYLDGEMEILSPALEHESRKKTLARLLEHWALETDTDLNGFGSWTLKKRPKKAAAEPDECYILGPARKAVPDLVIEVEWSRKLGLSKEAIYARLGVRELWTITAEGELVLRVLEGARWVVRTKSRVLPKLDVAWLFSFASIVPQSRAVRALRDAIRRRPR